MADFYDSSGMNSMQGTAGTPVSNKLIYLNELAQNRSGGFDEARLVLTKVLPVVDLNKIQELVFCHCWVGDSYPEIARMTDYDADYIKDVGYRLWRQLSDALQESVNKQNFRTIFKQRFQKVLEASQSITVSPTQSQQATSQLAGGGLAFSSTPHIDWGEAAELHGFVGRKAELEQLQKWLSQDKCRLIGLFGMGGIGKTALAMQLVHLAELVDQDHREFRFIIWRSLRNSPSPELLLQNLLQRLTNTPELTLSGSLEERITLLIEHLRQHRCLLILDEWDAILKPGALAGTYAEGYEGYGQLLRRIGESRHQSCLLLTSREKPAGVTLLDDKTLPVRLLHVPGLKFKDSQALLNSLGLSESASLSIPNPEAEELQTQGLNPSQNQIHIEKLWRYYSGTPLSLKVAAKTILDLFSGNVEMFLAQKSFIYGQIRSLLEQQFQRLSATESQVLRQLASFETGASLTELQTCSELNIPQDRLLEVLESLDRRSLLRLKNGLFVIPRLPKAFLDQQDL
jgi:NB-ARC domain